MNRVLDCKETEKLIPDFLDDSMDGKTMSCFLEHIDSCHDCKEELSIQFLVSEGLNALESGDSYDLQNALDDKLSQSRHQVAVHERVLWFTRAALFLIAFVLIVFVVYILKFGI